MTRIYASATSRRINIILPNHFRFWRFIRMSLLHAGSSQQNGFYRIVDANVSTPRLGRAAVREIDSTAMSALVPEHAQKVIGSADHRQIGDL